MGVITKYKLAFPDPELRLAVSNHLSIIPSFGLTDLVLDADIKVTMTTGAAGAKFEVTLFDLPEVQVQKLHGLLGQPRPGGGEGKRPVKVDLELGYLDGKVEKVMSGLVNKLSVKVDGGKLATKLEGLETATYAATERKVDYTLPASSTIGDAIGAALKQATPAGEPGVIDAEPRLQHLPTKPLQNGTLRGRLGAVLDRLVRPSGAAILLVDGRLWVGRPIEHGGEPGQPELVAERNLVKLEPFTKKITPEIAPYRVEPLKPENVHGFKFLVLGDPKLRPGQRLKPDVETYSDLSTGDFRVASVAHRFTLAGGYVCEGVALKTCPPGDETCRKQLEAGQAPSADAAAAFVNAQLENFLPRRPFIEVGEVKQYRAGGAGGDETHRADLYYNQKAPTEETQPSVRVAVEHDDDKVFLSKPMVSPFAWRKCGLVVPVYPGMKALLHHNQGLADDALVGGFLWSQTPALEPPANQPGDWWLCLPIDPPEGDSPADATKAANDLTAKSGLRTIEAKGLKISVGTGHLVPIGQRPELGAADELSIAHSSGAEIKIDSNGKVTINAPGGLEITGTVDIK